MVKLSLVIHLLTRKNSSQKNLWFHATLGSFHADNYNEANEVVSYPPFRPSRNCPWRVFFIGGNDSFAGLTPSPKSLSLGLANPDPRSRDQLEPGTNWS